MCDLDSIFSEEPKFHSLSMFNVYVNVKMCVIYHYNERHIFKNERQICKLCDNEWMSGNPICQANEQNVWQFEFELVGRYGIGISLDGLSPYYAFSFLRKCIVWSKASKEYEKGVLNTKHWYSYSLFFWGIKKLSVLCLLERKGSTCSNLCRLSSFIACGNDAPSLTITQNLSFLCGLTLSLGQGCCLLPDSHFSFLFCSLFSVWVFKVTKTDCYS